MAIQVNWGNREKDVVLVEFVGGWSWRDFEDAVDRSYLLTDSVVHQVDVIFDLRNSTELPHGALMYFKRMLGEWSDNRGILVLLSADMLVFDLIGSFYRMDPGYSSRIVLAKTMNEARMQLARMYPGAVADEVYEDDRTLVNRML